MATGFPDGFFARADQSADADFYSLPRFVTHIDATAISAVSALYADLHVGGRVLDLMSSWVSHLPDAPDHLTVVGLNRAELDANPAADERLVLDLNADPAIPFDTASFDHVLCCVSIDYLVRPVEVFAEVARVLVDGGAFVCTFSNRLFPTKAVRGWLLADDEMRCAIVGEYFRRSGGWDVPTTSIRIPPGGPTDPLYAVWARRTERT